MRSFRRKRSLNRERVRTDDAHRTRYNQSGNAAADRDRAELERVVDDRARFTTASRFRLKPWPRLFREQRQVDARAGAVAVLRENPGQRPRMTAARSRTSAIRDTDLA